MILAARSGDKQDIRKSALRLWHQRLRLANDHSVMKLVASNIVDGMDLSAGRKSSTNQCESCVRGQCKNENANEE